VGRKDVRSEAALVDEGCAAVLTSHDFAGAFLILTLFRSAAHLSPGDGAEDFAGYVVWMRQLHVPDQMVGEAELPRAETANQTSKLGFEEHTSMIRGHKVRVDADFWQRVRLLLWNR